MTNPKIAQIEEFLAQLISESTVERPVWNKELALEKTENKWNYVDGCMLLAFIKVYDLKQDKKIIRFVENYVDSFIDESGNIRGYEITEYNLDSINEGKVLLYLYERKPKEKYRLALERLNLQLKYQPRTPAGNYWHKLIYPYQVWLDGIYMANPFQLEYNQKFKQPEENAAVLKTFELLEKNLRDKKTGLYYHAYDATKLAFWSNPQSGLSQNFWLRSMGWLLMSMVDSLEIIQLSETEENFAKLAEIFRTAVKDILNFADADSKLFYQVIDAAGSVGNYIETSGSAAIAYSLLKGSRLALLPSNYRSLAQEMFENLAESKFGKDDSGFYLKDICLVAGLGGMPAKGSYKLRDGSYDYYISEPKVRNDAKGIAPFIFAYSEYLQSLAALENSENQKSQRAENV